MILLQSDDNLVKQSIVIRHGLALTGFPLTS
jgi:hypothetical protein